MNKIIKGIPGSGGTAIGKVKIIINEKHIGEFKAGEILVTRQTSPAWTPLFMAAKAVVTEVGGSLSHAAIVAREYGIPAVVGINGITGELKTGQLIEIDGIKGEIKVFE